MSLQKLNAFGDLCIGHLTRVAEHDTARALDLIVEEFTEILHVHLALVGVNHRRKSAKNCTLSVRALNRLYNVGKLTDARRLDKNSVRIIFFYYLLKRFRKVTDERATDTP